MTEVIIMEEPLLSCKRRKLATHQERSALDEFFSDRSRIIYSKAFRHLQRKAQIFSLENNTAVRTRLVHSLEVADVGRGIALKAMPVLQEKYPDFADAQSFIAVVENACLLHDLGNPPFGHFGEAAIRRWFKLNWESLTDASGIDGARKELFREIYLPDFLEFDGNPQGFRLVTGLHWDRDHFGMNLTQATLKSFVKYVRFPSDPVSSILPHTKKAGFFESERFVVKDLYGRTEGIRRFPLAYIMEVADDIAYCTSDISDSIEKGIVHPMDYYNKICQCWSRAGNKEPFPFVNHKAIQNEHGDVPNFLYHFFISYTRNLVKHAAQYCAEFWPRMLTGELADLVPAESLAGRSLATLKLVARQNIYQAEEIEKMELAGYALVSSLLEANKPLLTCSKERFEQILAGEELAQNNLEYEFRLVNRIPEDYRKYYRFQVKRTRRIGPGDEIVRELFHRCHLITDFISGLTDDKAWEMDKVYRGIDFK